LDEIDQALPQEVGKIAYMLVNGQGKQRAGKVGNACKIQRWRLMTISTGERTLAEIMAEIGKRPNAGQLVRLLSISAHFTYGAFSNLHHFKDGRSFADYLKQARTKNYGHAGEAFIRALINDNRDLGEAISRLEEIFAAKVQSSLEKRASAVFAAIALAGELAIEYGILPWRRGDSINAAQIGFEHWQEGQGKSNTEDQQILQALSDFLDTHGDSRFSAKQASSLDRTVINRAGWYENEGNERVYYFTRAGLIGAGAGYDIKRIVQALDNSGWIVEHDANRKTKKTRTSEGPKNLYYIQVKEIN
jgi:putative DNA primase/helicase